MKQTLLAIDDHSLPLRRNTCIYLSKPDVRAEPVLMPSPLESDAPDNLAIHFYGTVLHDGGIFRAWYYACHYGRNPDWSPRMAQQLAKTPGWVQGEYLLFQGPLCYAESKDGITWTKPALGQVLFKGSKANNALALPHTVVSGAIVIKDDADPDPARRYKMTYQFFPEQSEPIIPEYGHMPSVATAVSPDGLHWTVTGIPFLNQFVEPASFIKHNGQYIIHYQVMETWASFCGEGGTKVARTGAARVTHDWDHWPDYIAETFALPEPEDVSLRGANGQYDQVHLGVGAVSLGNVCVGLYGLWHNAENNQSFEKISCDFGLLISNDGVHFREPVKGHRFLRRDESPVTPPPEHVGKFNTILCQANGVLNVGDETRIYHGRWRNVSANEATGKYYYAEVALATLPLDRWGAFALNPGTKSGAVCSAPITLPINVSQISLNGTGAAGLAVELLDAEMRPIAGFSGGVVSDGLSSPVIWAGQDLKKLAGQAVRIQVLFERVGEISPRVYALYVNSK